MSNLLTPTGKPTTSAKRIVAARLEELEKQALATIPADTRGAAAVAKADEDFEAAEREQEGEAD